MITIDDIIQIGRCYSSEIKKDKFVFAGGTAVQCWLYNTSFDRPHKDIDLFIFDAEYYINLTGVDWIEEPYFCGGKSLDGAITSEKNHILVEIIYGGYVDSEITPRVNDVRLIEIKNVIIPLLSPEFIVISKISYPNVHNFKDLYDVLLLNQAEYLQNVSLLEHMLNQTSLAKLITVQDILNIKCKETLRCFVNAIRERVIQRFLRLLHINVEVLNPLQLFTLLDIGDELLNISSGIYEFIDDVLSQFSLKNHEKQIARLGLCFWAMAIPFKNIDVLDTQEVRGLIKQELPLLIENQSYWLSRQKTVLMTFRQIASLSNIFNLSIEQVLVPSNMAYIIRRILFEERSRVHFLTKLKAIHILAVRKNDETVAFYKRLFNDLLHEERNENREASNFTGIINKKP